MNVPIRRRGSQARRHPARRATDVPPLPEHAHRPFEDLVADEVARSHDLLGLQAQLGAGGDFGAQQVAGGNVRHLQMFLEARGLRALAGTGRAQKYQSHQLHS